MTEPAHLDVSDTVRGFYDGDDPSNPEEEEDDVGLLGMNPYVLWGLLVVSIIVSGPIVFIYAPESWGVARKLLATGIMGTLAHYCLFINRILVAKW